MQSHVIRLGFCARRVLHRTAGSSRAAAHRARPVAPAVWCAAFPLQKAPLVSALLSACLPPRARFLGSALLARPRPNFGARAHDHPELRSVPQFQYERVTGYGRAKTCLGLEAACRPSLTGESCGACSRGRSIDDIPSAGAAFR